MFFVTFPTSGGRKKRFEKYILSDRGNIHIIHLKNKNKNFENLKPLQANQCIILFFVCQSSIWRECLFQVSAIFVENMDSLPGTCAMRDLLQKLEEINGVLTPTAPDTVDLLIAAASSDDESARRDDEDPISASSPVASRPASKSQPAVCPTEVSQRSDAWGGSAMFDCMYNSDDDRLPSSLPDSASQGGASLDALVATKPTEDAIESTQEGLCPEVDQAQKTVPVASHAVSEIVELSGRRAVPDVGSLCISCGGAIVGLAGEKRFVKTPMRRVQIVPCTNVFHVRPYEPAMDFQVSSLPANAVTTNTWLSPLGKRKACMVPESA